MNTNDFDELINIPIGDSEIQAGYISGSDKVLVIKTGQGGSVYGYQNKYLEISRKMNEIYGCSVFVFATTDDSFAFYQREMQFISEKTALDCCKIYYMGVSKGGLIGCWYAESDERVEKVAAVNAPLMINFHNKTMPSLKKLSSKIIMYYGSLDPSYPYVPFASRFVTVKIIEGADHQMRGHLETYENIARELLT